MDLVKFSKYEPLTEMFGSHEQALTSHDSYSVCKEQAFMRYQKNLAGKNESNYSSE